MTNNGNREKEIDLSRVLNVFKKDFLKILMISLICGIAGWVTATLFLTPVYKANIDLLVNQKSNNQQTQFNVQQADLQAVNTYKDVLGKSVILNPVLKEIKHNDNFEGDLNDLQESISISNETNSQVISVSVKDNNAYTAADIANTIGRIFSRKIKKMMKIDNVAVVTKAKANTTPVFPNKKLSVVIGLLIGFTCSVLWYFIKDILDTTVRDEAFLTDELGLSNLGFVGHIEGQNALHVANVSDRQIGQKKAKRRV